jgi:membrane protein YqaA with SNARE-associated domain
VLKPIKKGLTRLQKYAGRWWYPPVIGFLALADLFVLVVPTDALLVTGVLLAPKRWFPIGLTVALGSAIGCAALSMVLQAKGLPFLLQLSPGLDHTAAWTWTAEKMTQWGAWGVFLIALSPMMQHPAIALAAMSGMAIPQIFFLVLGGRAVKYLFIAWLSSHAPHLLGKIMVLKTEVHEAGLDEQIEHPPPKTNA